MLKEKRLFSLCGSNIGKAHLHPKLIRFFSSLFQRMKSKIVREYQASIADTRASKARFQYLHQKLAHIKKLVSDYDHANLGRTASPEAQGHRQVAARVN